MARKKVTDDDDDIDDSNMKFAIFDHPGPYLHYSFFGIRENESNRAKAKQEEQNMIRLQTATHEGLVMEYTRLKSWGIRASRKFLKNDVVLRYCGTLLTEREGLEIEDKLIKSGVEDSYLYFFRFDSRYLCLDATVDDGSYGRLVNHSRLRPNCKAVGFMVDRKPAIGIVAVRDISVGEEILYDYGEKSAETLERLPWLVET